MRTDNTSASDADTAFDKVGRFLYRYASRAAAALIGSTPTDFVGQTTEPTICPDRPSDALKWFDRYVENVVMLIPELIELHRYSVALNTIVYAATYLEIRGFGRDLENTGRMGLAVIRVMRAKASKDPDTLNQLESLMHELLAKAALQGRRHEEALRHYARAEARADEWRRQTDLRNFRGTVLLQMNRCEEALEDFRAAQRHHSSEPVSARARALVAYNVGVALHRLGRDGEAMPYLDADLRWCRAQGDLVGEATTLNTIGNAYANLGDLEHAVDALSLAVERYEDCGDSVHAGNALNDLGLALALSGRHREAGECHRRDLAICHSVDDRYGAAKACIRIADNLIRGGFTDVDQARLFLADAELLRDEFDVLLQADFVMVEAEIAYAAGELDRGEQGMARARGLYQDAGYADAVLLVQLRQAHCLIRRGNTAHGIAVIERVIAVAAEDGGPNVLRVAKNMLAWGHEHASGAALPRSDCRGAP